MKIIRKKLKEMDLSRFSRLSSNVDDRRTPDNETGQADIGNIALDKNDHLDLSPRRRQSDMSSGSDPEPLPPMTDKQERMINQTPALNRHGGIYSGLGKSEMELRAVDKRLKIGKYGMHEEAPANNAGSGNIAGLGVGPQGEPGIRQDVRKRYKRRNKKGVQDLENDLALLRRSTPMMEEVNRGKFAGHDTFIVPSNTFHKARIEKRKGKHWKTYIGEDDCGCAIREYDRKHKGKKPIILQDEKTGAMCYARYGR